MSYVYELYGKEYNELTKEELIEYLERLGEQLRQGKKFGETLSELICGKRNKCFTAKDKSFYVLYLLRNYHYYDFRPLNKILFDKNLADLEHDERLYYDKIRRREKSGYIDYDFIKEHYGVSYEYLSPRQFKEYHSKYFVQPPRNEKTLRDTKAYKLFGKSRKNLNEQELKEYNKLSQREHRKNKKEI